MSKFISVKEELYSRVKGEAGQWFCLLDPSVYQVEIQNSIRLKYDFIHSRPDLPTERQSRAGKGEI